MNSEIPPQILDEIRAKLESERAEIINRSHIARNDLRERDQRPGDSIDVSNDEQGTSNELRFQDRDRETLARINEALQRIDDDEYGYCDSCGEPIGLGRLKAMPMATMCIDCKEEQERDQQRRDAANPGIFGDVDYT